MALTRHLRTYAPAIGIVAIALSIAWFFAATTLHYTRMGLPLDDSYIYLTYAKQIGRGQPFTYYPGGGYSAGATSVLWPMVLAPFWTLGARGHALVWVSYLACSALYAATAVGVWRVVRKLGGDNIAAITAVVLLVGIAPFAWTALSGMEVAFASALLVATMLLLIDQPATGPPSKRLAVCLGATALARPEAMLVVGAIVIVSVVARVRRRDPRAAVWWAAPVVPAIAWLVANRLLAGHWLPNTGVAKSYFYLPGFDWAFWREAVWSATGSLLKGVFWDDASPLVWPRLVAIGYLVGSARILVWAKRHDRWLAGIVIVAAPLALMFAVVASSGLWSFHNYRYIAPAFPLIAIAVGGALGSARGSYLYVVIGGVVVAIALAAAPRFVDPVVAFALTCTPLALLLPRHWARIVVLALVLGVFTRPAGRALAGDARLYAQGVIDTNTQVVAIGRHVRDKLPGASVMFHDAGAIAYYGDGEVYDMLGLVTNHQARVANHGPGARFELLERLPPARRPTHFAYYPAWLGVPDFFGDVLLQTPIRPRIPGLAKTILVGDIDMQLVVASFDHVGTGELPFDPHPGWRVVDRIDIADLDSEDAHDWQGALGRRKAADAPARWSFVARWVGPHGLVLDGGRTIRPTPDGAGEQLAFAVDPSKPARLVLRTGGPPAVLWHEPIVQPVTLALYAGDRELGRATLPPPDGKLVERAFELPAGVTAVRTVASGPYRCFHWFVLQPG
ncbi:MAG TPA: hypothetical protein VFQ53_39180 [Kofleriaceae bacterium]|nr:hypothetical protein [Kofleriaceae bacterium]